MDEITITYRGEELTIVGRYEPADYGVWTKSSGDPGEPPSPAEFYIAHIYDWQGNEISYQYTNDQLHEIEEKVLEYYAD